MLRDPVTLGIAAAFTWLAVASSIIQIVMHLRHYTEPMYQRYICRIIFMVPFYAVTSWLSLMHREASIYFDVPRDCYEAWVIYNFLSLCMAYVGGPGAVVVKSEGKYIEPSWALMTCCWPPMKVDGFLLRKCKQGTLQFVLAKPILASMTLILFGLGLYEDGDWSFGGGFLYVSIIYNVCYTIALYYLLIFYVGTEELLEPFHPLMKLILIKAVIFLTFWQSIVISFFASKFDDPSDQGALQDFIVCLEMLMSAGFMWVSFPHTEFKVGEAMGLRLTTVMHAISIADVVSDVMHQFNPNYKTYVLYHDGGPAEHTKLQKLRAYVKKQGALKAKAAGVELKGPRRSNDGMSEDESDDGQGHAHEGFDPHMDGRKDWKGKMLGWIPGVSEKDTRSMGMLVDSDSDADFNEGPPQHDEEMGALVQGSREGLPEPTRPGMGHTTSFRSGARDGLRQGEALIKGLGVNNPLNQMAGVVAQVVGLPGKGDEESDDDDDRLL